MFQERLRRESGPYVNHMLIISYDTYVRILNGSIPKVSKFSQPVMPPSLHIREIFFFVARTLYSRSTLIRSTVANGRSRTCQTMVRNRQSSCSTWAPVEPVEGSQSRPDIKEVWRRLQMIAGLRDLRPRLAPCDDDDPQVIFAFLKGSLKAPTLVVQSTYNWTKRWLSLISYHTELGVSGS
jgi:hypothetical protein